MKIKLKMFFMFILLPLTFGGFSKDGIGESNKFEPDQIGKQRDMAIDDKGITYVVLNRQNDFIDELEKGRFERSGTSGPGTGQFKGEGFEFAKGSCLQLDKDWFKKKGWRSEMLGCGDQLFRSDWCARLKSDHSVQYTLHFLSWTIGPDGPRQLCLGDCSNSQTTYIRTRHY